VFQINARVPAGVLTFQQSGPAFTLSSPTFAAYQLVSTSTGYTLGDSIEGRFYNFNSSGTLVSIQDRAGNSHSLTYTAGNLTGISDGLGRVLTLVYDSSNRIVSVSDGTRTVSYAYTGSNLTSFTDVRGNVTSYAYDSSTGLPGLMAQKTRPLGNIVTGQVWDAAGHVTSQSDGNRNTVGFAYGSDLSTVQTDPAGKTRKYVFDTNGLLLSLTDENGSTSTYTYDSAGRQASGKDSLGFQTLTAFDPASGRPLT
jgi:YD repeat-containing protein